MEEEILEFKHWKTGESIKYKLNFSHPSEQKTDLICPFDQTPLIFTYDMMSKGHFCPNCEIIYKHKVNTQESVDAFFKEYFLKISLELNDLDQKRKDLAFFLEKAEELIKNLNKHKANLSADDFRK